MRELTQSHKDKIMTLIKSNAQNKDLANFCVVKGRFDLEIAIKLSEDNSILFSDKKIEEIKNKIIEITGFSDPVVYMFGYMPEHMLYF